MFGKQQLGQVWVCVMDADTCTSEPRGLPRGRSRYDADVRISVEVDRCKHGWLEWRRKVGVSA